jgi:hypothetical protein
MTTAANAVDIRGWDLFPGLVMGSSDGFHVSDSLGDRQFAALRGIGYKLSERPAEA